MVELPEADAGEVCNLTGGEVLAHYGAARLAGHRHCSCRRCGGRSNYTM